MCKLCLHEYTQHREKILPREIFFIFSSLNLMGKIFILHSFNKEPVVIFTAWEKILLNISVMQWWLQG